MGTRPRPPEDLLGAEGALTGRPFRPAPELAAWAHATFIAEDAPLLNEEHEHLRDAAIGFVWTSTGNARHGNTVVGQAEMTTFQGGRWSKGRQIQQLCEWFGELPDFLVTIDAGYADQASDAAFCSLVEHELLHCGQERDGFGAPKFRRDGSPAFALRGHDVEEFVSIVVRYGVGAAAGRTADLVRAAAQAPLIGADELRGACGTCGGRL
ncbi:hypothetical protein F0L46_08375 [Salinarimonas soli]|uniref:Putative phage metallopeptidase domain-containing protein n=1 Tax=Salinarimonas soli TaxID=1638099 RepID=A0A5B2VFB1_9HYPH|nr:hypothetical protein F0L46_08375 [Salinarimonas soli]